MQKENLLKYFLYYSFIVLLSSCGSGNGTTKTDQISPIDPMNKYPNPFDNNSVRDISFTTKNLDDTLLPYVDLSKVGSHIEYKIIISNPNEFSVNLTNLQFGNNYYFEKNDNKDNCFNQSWYIKDETNVGVQNLNMPANARCSLYTTSIWYVNNSNELANIIDYVNYEVKNDSNWGYTINANKRNKIWCKDKCSSTTPVAELPATNNSISFHLIKMSPLSDEVINSIPFTGFSLNGAYVFNGECIGNYLGVNRTKIIFNKDKDIIEHYKEPLTIGYQLAFDYCSFRSVSPRRDGEYAAADFHLHGEQGANQVYYFNFKILSWTDNWNTRKTLSLVQGQDNKVWLSSEIFMPRYNANDDYWRTLNNWSKLSPNLKDVSVNVLATDLNGNVVAKDSNNKIYCYSVNNNYNEIQADPTLKSNNQILANDDLYAIQPNNQIRNYYDFNQNKLSFVATYKFDANTCKVTDKFLVAPYQMIITDKFTALKTNEGYVAFAPEETYNP